MFIIRDVSFAVFHFNQKVVVVIRLSNILSRQRLQVLTKRFIDYRVRKPRSAFQCLAEQGQITCS